MLLRKELETFRNHLYYEKIFMQKSYLKKQVVVWLSWAMEKEALNPTIYNAIISENLSR